MTRQELALEARELSSEDRLALAMDLWELAEPADVEFSLTAEHRAELDRRIAADDADASPDEGWEDLRAKLLRRDF